MTFADSPVEPFNVLIVGGGVAGIEAALYLEEHDRLARSNA
jgi:thioredoxin reductase